MLVTESGMVTDDLLKHGTQVVTLGRDALIDNPYPTQLGKAEESMLVTERGMVADDKLMQP